MTCTIKHKLVIEALVDRNLLFTLQKQYNGKSKYVYLLPCCYSYKRVVTPRRAGTAVLLCWLVSIVVGLTPMLGWNNLQSLRDNGSLVTDDLLVTCEFETVISMDYMVYFNFFGWVLPPLLLMLAIYVEIFYMIHKQLNKKVGTCVGPILFDLQQSNDNRLLFKQI